MRVWGRINLADGSKQWVAVESAGDDQTFVRITQLIQVLKLALGESPFYANFGIPAQRSVIQQIMPDFYVNATQSQFADYFASLTVTKLPPRINGRSVDLNPTYNVEIVTNQGSMISTEIGT